MEHVNHSELATTLANLYNMVHRLTDQVIQLVHRFDSLESANLLLKSELDRVTAIVNKLSASNTAAQSRSNDSALVTVIDKTAMENPGTEASCYASRPISSNTETETWTTVVKKAPQRGAVTSVRRRIAIARVFSEFVGYETVYIPRYRRLNRAEIRRRFNHLGLDTTRIIDISFPARTVIGLLVHQAFKAELIKTLQDCKIEIISFSPVALNTLLILNSANVLLQNVRVSIKLCIKIDVSDILKKEIQQIARSFGRRQASWRLQQLRRLQSKRNRILRQYRVSGVLSQLLSVVEHQIGSLQNEITANNILRAGRHWREHGERSGGYLKRTIESCTASRHISSLKESPGSEVTSNANEMQIDCPQHRLKLFWNHLRIMTFFKHLRVALMLVNIDIIENFQINFIESAMIYYLNLLESPSNPLSRQQLERTAAVHTTIFLVNNLFMDINDIVGFKWFEVTSYMTSNTKWDGIGFSRKNEKVVTLLVELSGGLKHNCTNTKNETDINKLIPGAIKGIELTSAMTEQKVPIPEYIIRFFGNIC
ncbi:hypothetical protein G6F57_008276 [Rhizopus arrhizus]|uniref:Uncharacterized protein n=1 Tax=Rhizopus oryzae TaxID=64495 RepID=A0A9P6XBE0_RHIOR|nr:hypothetical protein G6F23_001844 [Rhizopus arrhizus]KAG1419485.1 hypothetical protein G6F58_004594 [Rhizopus delemar]KAG0764938.1 hypothetical protein G6F24_004817 [Rhizopus arrhizus]KAG0877400.1 hypothetical protein G6F16_001652 [Rhizopus arrhizus]KAG0916022.1 hypothetical protein G6F33_002787 [Rhizopus arrhizus]